jgi:hypothetical protein
MPRGFSTSTAFLHSDFLIAASQLAAAIVVTLDRVVC